MRFMATAERLRQAGHPNNGLTVERRLLAAHPIWSDRLAQGLAGGMALLNVALWGYLFTVYPDLSGQITLQFPPVGDIVDLHSRQEIFKIPGTAAAFLAVNLLAALGLQRHERAVTYFLLGGAALLQVLFWAAAGIAIINA